MHSRSHGLLDLLVEKWRSLSIKNKQKRADSAFIEIKYEQ